MNNYIKISNFNSDIANQGAFYLQAQSQENMFKILGAIEHYASNLNYSVEEAIIYTATEMGIDLDSLTDSDKAILKYKVGVLRMQYRD
jgi:hypothetical protein